MGQINYDPITGYAIYNGKKQEVKSVKNKESSLPRNEIVARINKKLDNSEATVPEHVKTFVNSGRTTKKELEAFLENDNNFEEEKPFVTPKQAVKNLIYKKIEELGLELTESLIEFIDAKGTTQAKLEEYLANDSNFEVKPTKEETETETETPKVPDAQGVPETESDK